jgi:DNA-binding response OmpR family regulator
VRETNGIIAVTEDPFIRKLLGDLLKKRGYRVVGSDAPGTIDWIESGTEIVDLVITNAPNRFEAVADKVAVLYLSAAPDPEAGSHFSAFRALRKPFHPEQLLAAVNDLYGAV